MERRKKNKTGTDRSVSTGEGIPDLSEPLQEQESNLFSLISLASILLSSPPLPLCFHTSITLSSQHSIAPWNARPLGPGERGGEEGEGGRTVWIKGRTIAKSAAVNFTHTHTHKILTLL